MEIYAIPHCNSYVESDRLKVPANLLIRDNQARESDPSHLYARVDSLIAENEEIVTQDNNAYESSSTYKATKINVDNFPSCKNPNKKAKKRTGRMKRSQQCCKATCAALILLMAAVALAEASLALVLALQVLRPTNFYTSTTQQKEHTSYPNSSTTATLKESEETRDQVVAALEMKIANLNASQVQLQDQLLSRIISIATAVQQLVSNETEITQPPLASPGLRNCSTTVEASCTVGIAVGRCITARVPSVRNGSIVVHSSCTRTNSNEQNPLVGVLDVTDNQLECLCYVIEIDGVRRRNPTLCNLLVTRCKI